jgi:hypothetical protein
VIRRLPGFVALFAKGRNSGSRFAWAFGSDSASLHTSTVRRHSWACEEGQDHSRGKVEFLASHPWLRQESGNQSCVSSSLSRAILSRESWAPGLDDASGYTIKKQRERVIRSYLSVYNAKTQRRCIARVAEPCPFE